MNRRAFGLALLALAPLLQLALAIGGVMFARQGGFAPYRVPDEARVVTAATPAQRAEGEYLARIGNCATCHGVRGGVPFTGGRAFRTAWGTIHSTNLTPDPATGLGDWSLAEFRHAMRNGVGRHGALYPAFPYANFALLTDADLAESVVQHVDAVACGEEQALVLADDRSRRVDRTALADERDVLGGRRDRAVARRGHAAAERRAGTPGREARRFLVGELVVDDHPVAVVVGRDHQEVAHRQHLLRRR